MAERNEDFRPDDLPRKERDKSRYDPEYEVPDPKQVEKDIQDAEKAYRQDERKKPAA